MHEKMKFKIIHANIQQKFISPRIISIWTTFFCCQRFWCLGTVPDVFPNTTSKKE